MEHIGKVAAGMLLLYSLTGVVVPAIGIMLCVFSIIFISATIILLCFSIKEKVELKEKEIDEIKIKRIGILAILSVIVMICSCIGCTFSILPILALIFINSNSKTAFRSGNIIEATKQANLSLNFLIISNILILIVAVLGTIIGVIGII